MSVKNYRLIQEHIYKAGTGTIEQTPTRLVRTTFPHGMGYCSSCCVCDTCLSAAVGRLRMLSQKAK